MFRLLEFRSTNLIHVLSALRTKALRSGVWFTSLSHEDRVLVSMISRHIKIVKSATLATVMARIMGKVLYAFQNLSYLSRIERIGRPIAQIMSEKAYSMGNKDALEWAHDLNYVRYLGKMYPRALMFKLTATAGVAQ
ncbi:MAG: hypothetical protein E6K85_01155 [Thaumarchaeota archaeon]|nr:MAG: hypothetical protein E6K85_01155 [Nitrososphaerota archaeon]